MLKKAVILIAIGACIWAGTMYSCHKELKPTTVSIKDSIRHYYPIILGDELSITCELENTGDEDLAITDVQPSNFSIVMDTSMPHLIPPGKKEALHFVFHSEKNVGFAEHTIRIFGNIVPNGVAELTFDTHIVRPTLDEGDYEEVYYREKQSMIEEFVDGERGQKGYWVDNGDEDSTYQRSYKKYLFY